MADTFSGTASVFGSPHVQTAFDTLTRWFLNDQPLFSNVATVHPVKQAMPGSTVTLTIEGQMANATTPLTELVDVDAVALPAPRQVSVTLNEYGNAVSTTHKLEATAFSASVIQDTSKIIAQNCGDSIDSIYQTVCDGAANKLYIGTAGALQLTDPTTNLTKMTTAAGAAAATLLRDRKAAPLSGTDYVGFIHPDVSFDLRQEAGSAWFQAHTNGGDTAAVYTGYVGRYGGVSYVESPRCAKVAGSPVAYTSYYFGQEGILSAIVDAPGVRVGPVTDKFSRFRPIGWYAFFGVTRFRENALQLVKSTSSIASLSGAYDPKA
jgi:N4-gp56 family major capsid protein